jgi:hypothetical protein
VKRLLTLIGFVLLATALGASWLPAAQAQSSQGGARVHMNAPLTQRAIPEKCYEEHLWCTDDGDLTVQIETCPSGEKFWYRDKSPQLDVPFAFVLNNCLYRIWLHEYDSDGTEDGQCISPGRGAEPNSDIGYAPHDLQVTTNPNDCP